jgi:hypothetical protein
MSKSDACVQVSADLKSESAVRNSVAPPIRLASKSEKFPEPAWTISYV